MTSNNFRTYGEPPFDVVLIHGGPGAAGEMAPVARELSSMCGVLEPLQTATTLEGQVAELRIVLEQQAAPASVLVGFSWGAWLSSIVAARYPALVRKLILVSSGPFEQKYVAVMQQLRESRLTAEEQLEFASALSDATLLKRLGELSAKTDTYDAVAPDEESESAMDLNGDIFQAVMRDAIEMRTSGQLLAVAAGIVCPVVAIHGTYDPHPAAGVEQPLGAVLKDFRFVLLDKCGHKPWIERHAREKFYAELRNELTAQN